MVRTNNKTKQYVRDARSPLPKTPNTSKVMSANRSRNTKPEQLLRKKLWRTGIRGYRLNWKKAPGRPDIAFPGRKIAIFVHGCYWHRCPTCSLPIPKYNATFWAEKFDKNVKRDEKKRAELEKLGWKVFVVWECQLKTNLDFVISEMVRVIEKN